MKAAHVSVPSCREPPVSVCHLHPTSRPASAAGRCTVVLVTRRPASSSREDGLGPETGWVLEVEGSRADGDTNALRRDLFTQRPGLERDASVELRLDLVCARDGSATVRIWSRPRRENSQRRKPRHET